MFRNVTTPTLFQTVKYFSSMPNFYWRPSLNTGIMVWTTHVVSALTGTSFEKQYVHDTNNGSGWNHDDTDKFLTSMSTIKSNGIDPAAMYGAKVNYDDVREVLNASHHLKESLPYIKIALSIRFPEIFSFFKNLINESNEMREKLTHDFLQDIEKLRQINSTETNEIRFLAKSYVDNIERYTVCKPHDSVFINTIGEKSFIDKFSEKEIEEINVLGNQYINSQEYENIFYFDPIKKLEQLRTGEHINNPTTLASRM